MGRMQQSANLSKEMLNAPSFAHLTKMCCLFLELGPRWAKDLSLWLHQNCRAVFPMKLKLLKQCNPSGLFFFIFQSSFSDLVPLCPGMLSWGPEMKLRLRYRTLLLIIAPIHRGVRRCISLYSYSLNINIRPGFFLSDLNPYTFFIKSFTPWSSSDSPFAKWIIEPHILCTVTLVM